MLEHQLIEERYLPTETIYKKDTLQSEIEKMIFEHDELIENCGEQPQFILSQYPTKKKERKLVNVISKFSFLQNIIGQ